MELEKNWQDNTEFNQSVAFPDGMTQEESVNKGTSIIKPQKPSLGHEEKKESVTSKTPHEADGILNKKDKVKVDDSELLFFGNTSIRKKKRSLTNFKEGVRSTVTEKKKNCCLM